MSRLLFSRRRSQKPRFHTQIVGSRGSSAITVRTATTLNYKRTYRERVYILNDCDDLQLAECGYYTTTGEVNLGNDQIIEAALEIGAQTVPFTWDGGNQLGTIVNGAALYTSDKLKASAFGLSKFTKNTQVWLRRCIEVPSGGKFFSTAAYVPAITDDIVVYMVTGTASQVTGNGPLNTTTPYTSNNDLYSHHALLGRPLRASARSILLVGDSIMQGTGDNQGDGYSGAGGWGQRGLAAMTQPIPWTRIAHVGTTMSSWGDTAAAMIASQKRFALFPYVTDVFNDYGHNDPPATAAATMSRLLEFAKAARSLGVKRCYQMMITGRTTSTDSWATTANQTEATDYTSAAFMDQLNQLIPTHVNSTEFDAVFDPRPYVHDATFPYRWIANGTANYSTVDGTHFSSAFQGVSAGQVGAAFAAFMNTQTA